MIKVISILFLSVLLAACNTISGAGKDVSAVGTAVTKAADGSEADNKSGATVSYNKCTNEFTTNGRREDFNKCMDDHNKKFNHNHPLK